MKKYIDTQWFGLDFERGDIIHITLKNNPYSTTQNSKGKAIFCIEYKRQNFKKEFYICDRHTENPKHEFISFSNRFITTFLYKINTTTKC